MSDSIEILVAVEKAFGIKIPDQEAEKIITVGDFHNSVWHHLKNHHSDKCKSQALFYKLRSTATTLFDHPVQDFVLDSCLNDIFPTNNRRLKYFQFAEASDLTLPGLVLTKSWSLFINLLGVIMIAGSFLIALVLINFFDYSKWLLLYPVIGGLATHLISQSLNSKRTIIRPAKVRDFAHHVLVLNYPHLPNQNESNRRDVESVINFIISDKAGLDLNKITTDKKICADLGID